MRKLLIGVVALALLATAAYAVQLGTSGTNKQNQQSGLRIGIPIMLNNTATATAGAATLNAAGLNPTASGVITTEALTTLGGSDYTLTLTNNLIASTDLVFATVANGTNTLGAPRVGRVQPATGSVVIVVRNGNGNGGTAPDSTLNGTLKIGFLLIKQSAHNSD